MNGLTALFPAAAGASRAGQPGARPGGASADQEPGNSLTPPMAALPAEFSALLAALVGRPEPVSPADGAAGAGGVEAHADDGLAEVDGGRPRARTADSAGMGGTLAPGFRTRIARVVERMRREFGHSVQVLGTPRSPEAVDVLVDGSYDNPEGYARLARIAREEGLLTRPHRPGHAEVAATGAEDTEPDGAVPGDRGSAGAVSGAVGTRPARVAIPPRPAPTATVATVASPARPDPDAVARVARVAHPAQSGEPAGTDGAAPAASGPSTVEAVEAVDRDPANLDPLFRERFDRVVERMEREFGHEVRLVEGRRSPARQAFLFEQGRSRPGPVVTWTEESRHLTGRAADVVVDGSYDHPEGYARLAQIAREEGLRTLPRDPGHLELAVQPDGRPSSGGEGGMKLAAGSKDAMDVEGAAEGAPTNGTARGGPGQEDAGMRAGPGRVGGSPAGASPGREPRAAMGAASSDRVARVQEVRDGQALRPASHVTLRLDDTEEGPARIRVDLRGRTVDATIEVGSESRMERLRRQAGELHRALSRHGLDLEALRIRSGVEAREAGPAVRIPVPAAEAQTVGAATRQDAPGDGRERGASTPFEDHSDEGTDSRRRRSSHDHQREDRP